MNLIQMQDQAIAEMQAPRTSEKRAWKHRRAVLRAYESKAIKLGYTAEQANQQRRDILDMYNLQVICDNEGADE